MNRLYNPNRRRFSILIPVAIILASAATLYSVPQILQAERFKDAKMRENRLRIEKMTKTERDSLKRKFKNYEALSEERKEDYRKMHETLEEDAKKGGNLTEVMQNYDKWLLTLTPWQLEDIKSSTSNEERKGHVADFLQQQEERRSSRNNDFRGFSIFRNRSFRSFLSSNSVSGMKLTMKDVLEIARHLEKELKTAVKIEKPKYSENKYLVVLRSALEAHKKSEQEKKVGYIDDIAIVAIMEKSNANPNLIARIKKSAENSTGKYDVLSDVLQTIRNDWRSQYRKQKDKYIGLLAKDVLIKIRTRSPRERKVRLEWEFLNENAPEYTKLIQTYFRNYYRRNDSSRSKNQRGNRSRSSKKNKRKLFR